jgi:prepilin-type N-terminal cleavage/methylation domain-containing protein
MKGVRHTRQAGFTLPELLAVVAIFGVLASISFFLLKPQNLDAQRRNSERQTNVALIAQALGNYHEKTGSLPPDIDVQTKAIGSDSGQVDLCKVLVPGYMTDLPMDPLYGQVTEVDSCNAKGQDYVSGYTVERSNDSSAVTLRAPNAEDGVVITVTKHF